MITEKSNMHNHVLSFWKTIWHMKGSYFHSMAWNGRSTACDFCDMEMTMEKNISNGGTPFQQYRSSFFIGTKKNGDMVFYNTILCSKKRSQKKLDRIKQEIYTIIWNKLNSNADLNELSVFGISSLITKPGFQDSLWFLCLNTRGTKWSSGLNLFPVFDWLSENGYQIQDYFRMLCPTCQSLIHWGRATHICVSKLTIIASNNGLSPGRRQAIIWNNVRILSIGLLRTNFSEILIEILTFSFKKMRLKVSSGKWWPFCLGLNELIWEVK